MVLSTELNALVKVMYNDYSKTSVQSILLMSIGMFGFVPRFFICNITNWQVSAYCHVETNLFPLLFF